MKIILLINSLGAGGAERSMAELARFLLNQKEVEVKIVCLERRTVGIEEEVKKTGVETLFYSGKNSWFSKMIFVGEIVKKEDPDIIHSALADSNLVLRFSRILSGKGRIVQSLVSTPYSLERRKDRRLPWYKFQLVKAIDKLSARLTPKIHFHAITEEVLNHHRDLYNIKENYDVIHRGRKSNSSYMEAVKNETFTVINVGRQEFAKGQIVLLKALALIKEEHPEIAIRLEILGREGNFSADIKSYIEKKDLKNYVFLEGFVHDVEKRLASAHVFAFPSFYEGLGGALIEAFSAGLPCICSDIPTFQEVVGSEENALFAPPGDYEKLAERILLLHQDEELRATLGRRSRSRFEESFQLETINQKMFGMYKKLKVK